MANQTAFVQNEVYHFVERIIPIEDLPTNDQLAVGDASPSLVRTLARKGGTIECCAKEEGDTLVVYSGSRSIKAARQAVVMATKEGNIDIATQVRLVRVIIFASETPDSYMRALALSKNFNRSDNIPDEISRIREGLAIGDTVIEMAESIGTTESKFRERYAILLGNKKHEALDNDFIEMFINGYFTFERAKQIFKLNPKARKELKVAFLKMLEEDERATITEDMVTQAFVAANKAFKQLTFGDAVSEFDDFAVPGVNTDQRSIVEQMADAEEALQHQATFKGFDGYRGDLYEIAERKLDDTNPEVATKLRTIRYDIHRHLDGGVTFNVAATIKFLEQLQEVLDGLLE